MEKVNFERLAAIAICAVVGVLGVYALFRYALGIFLPFICGIALGALVRKPAAFLSRKLGVSEKVCGVILFVLVLALICFGALFAVDRLIGELLRLAKTLTDGGGESLGNMITDAGDYLSNLTARLPVLRELRDSSGSEEFWERVDSTLAESVRGGMSELGAAVPRVAAQVAAALPEVFVFLTVTVITGFFFASGSVDLFAIERVLSERAASMFKKLRERAVTAVTGWFRAYMLILGLTFFELFVGFSVLGVGYSFLAALGVALVDILPLFGAGAVLVPWAIIMLLTGDRVMGVGLLVLWATVSVVRQFAEPKIIGKSLGISPVLTLLAMYAGLRLFGVAGMITAPAALMLVKAFFFDKKREENNMGERRGGL